MEYELQELLKKRGAVPKRAEGGWEKLIPDIIKLVNREHKDEVKSILNYLESDMDRALIINYVEDCL